jgi:hypothetical protein
MSPATRTRPPFLERGTKIAGYEINNVIGHGGMGVVYEATQFSLKRKVALKLLAPHLSDDERFRDRFRREGEMQGRLDHPHIVTVHEAGESKYGLFLAMRMVRGPRLKDLVLARDLNAERTVRLLGPIADALDSAHEEGLIHRDVKPQNILVGGRDHAYLADFGLTKLPGEKSITETGQFMGTLDYVAPEQIVGEPPTTRTDVYAFGAVLCECLTGSVPFLRQNEAAVLYAHLSDDPPRLSEREPKLPQALDDVVARALAKEPEERYATAGELMDEVEEALGGRRLRGIRQPVPIVPPTERTTRLEDDDGPGTHELELATGRLESQRRRAIGRRRRVAIASAVAGIAAAGGALAGLLTDEATLAAPGAESRSIALQLPKGWTATERPQRVPGLPLRDAVGATDGRRTIVAGVAPDEPPNLLPRAFRLRVDAGPVGSAQLVSISGTQAMRHTGLKFRDSSGNVAAYAVPTSVGVATVICRAPSGQRIGGDCEQAAKTLELRRGKAKRLMPSIGYGLDIDQVMGDLQPRRRNLRQVLAKASNRYQQAQAAGGVATAYDRTARRLRSIKAPPAAAGAHRFLIDAMRDTATAYRAMKNAADAFDREGFLRARGRTRINEAKVQAGLNGLRQIGYTIL